jgi:hypothetical protein
VFDFYRVLPVTLPDEASIQFINTTNNTKDNKIDIGEECWSVTAGKDKIYIGGDDKVIILNTEGSFVREITTNGINNNLLYNERNDQLLLRQKEGLCCINLDGHVIYRYDISGLLGGLAVDQQGHVYIGGAHDIHRLSPDGTFRDIVLSELSFMSSKYKNPSFTKYKNPSFTKKYKNPSFTKKYKNPSFTKKYKNPSFTKKYKMKDFYIFL